MYGTTKSGGGGNRAAVFEVSPTGAERVVYRCSGRGDGSAPNSLVIQNGVLYGTARGNMAAQLRGNPGGRDRERIHAQVVAANARRHGDGELAGGAAIVRLEPTFAASIEPGAGYRVFLTPNGDTRGFFVASKTAAGFAVRESQGGRSKVTFDYRIVATAQGQAGQRMAVMSAGALPRVSAPRAKAASGPPAPLLNPALQP